MAVGPRKFARAVSSHTHNDFIKSPSCFPTPERHPLQPQLCAMTIRLLCHMAFYFLGAGLMEADIYQNPRHRVIGTGKKITLECSQTMGHDKMYWYQQDPGMELHLIHYSYGVNSTERGDFSSESTVSRIRIEHFPLTLESTSPSHTSQYLCASSEYTVLHGYRHSAQKGLPLRWEYLAFRNLILNYRNPCKSSQTPQP
uniref:T cell receptor beta variable 25-1 n=1 Tax=Papio anubis TaxID=9555 RepID=A0A8I5NUB0_PAPAN